MVAVPRDENRVPALMGTSATDGSSLVPVYANDSTNGLYTHEISSSVDSDHDIKHAINEISSTYGVTVSVDSKKKSLLKFGRNEAVGTSYATIWFTGQDDANETYVAANTNSIDTVSSSNAGDTQTITIEGHTESGGNKTFVTQNTTLNGQTKVVLATPLNRCTRLYNTSATNFAGDIYVYEDTAIVGGKPSTTTKIHLTVDGTGGKNQSEKASTSLSSVDYWIITNFYSGYIEKAGSGAVADVALEIRQNAKVFRTVANLVISQGGHVQIDFDPFVIAPANSDVRLRVKSSTTAQEITGGIDGYLAIAV